MTHSTTIARNWGVSLLHAQSVWTMTDLQGRLLDCERN